MDVLSGSVQDYWFSTLPKEGKYYYKNYIIVNLMQCPLNQQLLQCLECIQNHAVRLCRNLSKFDHVSDHY